MNSNDTFNTSLSLRLDWSEMDLFGHINNVSFFKYLQAARVNYWDQVGITELHRTENIGPMLAQSQCTFLKPLHFPGTITIHSKLESIGNSSFVLLHQIRDEEKEIVAEGRDVMVLFDFNGNQKTTIPEKIRKKISQQENN